MVTIRDKWTEGSSRWKFNDTLMDNLSQCSPLLEDPDHKSRHLDGIESYDLVVTTFSDFGISHRSDMWTIRMQ